eukprot:TRINITY_DN32152_c0_g1_i1.p1 TRINITY_DN32152_c0_g1~~TRINITY_DN32152_c0_g1_i1.p1  ORF type:complete len:187 (+),score=88.66 TRINITY_DN32152_c0_g1_i1:76-636(+)
MAVVTRPMYGGAMEVALPGSYVDTSEIREVPDHQEVWADIDTSQSFILEILQCQDGLAGTALADFHFREVAKANGCAAADARVLETRQLAAQDLPHFARFAGADAAVLVGEQVAGKYNEAVKNVVRLEMLVVRLPAPIDSELLITINTPTQVNAQSSEQKLATAQASFFNEVLTTLKINDTGLFGC